MPKILVTSNQGRFYSDLAEVEPLLRATCTHEIDATQPVDVVVEQPVEIATKASVR